MPRPPRAVDLPILGPCPSDVELERDPGASRVFCDQCRKDVHVLSHMTKVEAAVFLEAHAGERLCVSYQVDDRGELRFRAPGEAPLAQVESRVPNDFVPSGRLLRRARWTSQREAASPGPSAARIAAAASLAALTIACTPTSRPADVRAEAALREPPKLFDRDRFYDVSADEPSITDVTAVEPCSPDRDVVASEVVPPSPKATRRPPKHQLKRGMIVSRRLRGDVALPD